MTTKYYFSFVLAFSTLVIWTKIFFFYSSFLRTNDKDKARLTDKSLMNTLRICPLDVDKSLMHCPSNNCIFPYKIVKTLVNLQNLTFSEKCFSSYWKIAGRRPAIFSGTPVNFGD